MSKVPLIRDIDEYHAHVYFDDITRTTAVWLREEIALRFGEEIVMHSIADTPRGPHGARMFGLDIPKDHFPAVLSFLLLNHGPHSILFHPVTGNELLDHTHHALWLGLQRPLDLGVLA